MSEKGIQEGPPLFIESCLSVQEWEKCRKSYSTYSHNFKERPLSDFTPGLIKWRWRMGGTLTEQEIFIINRRLEETLLKAGLKP